jgi:hypothetical protein
MSGRIRWCKRLASLTLTAVLVLAPFVGAVAAPGQELGYDPRADASDQLDAAKAEGAAEHKLVLLIAGGDWCVWCHYLAACLKPMVPRTSGFCPARVSCSSRRPPWFWEDGGKSYRREAVAAFIERWRGHETVRGRG